MNWFDESRLDHPGALAAIDPVLRSLAESGSRVRREAVAADVVQRGGLAEVQTRAVVAAGADSRLLRAVLEPWCPVPFVVWGSPSLPGWAGSLDLVVVLAPDGSDHASASAAAEAVRRGCQLLVACPAGSLVADHAEGRWTTLLTTITGDPLATAVVTMDHLSAVGLGPRADADEVAEALDAVAVACSPHRDLAVNPAKTLAIGLADALPVVWGGSPLAARAARRLAEGLRRGSGRPAIAGEVDHLLPVVAAVTPRDVFEDPLEAATDVRPAVVVLDDGSEDAVVREERGRLLAACERHGVRAETITAVGAGEVAQYASLLLTGHYVTAYLSLGLGRS